MLHCHKGVRVKRQEEKKQNQNVDGLTVLDSLILMLLKKGECEIDKTDFPHCKIFYCTVTASTEDPKQYII